MHFRSAIVASIALAAALGLTACSPSAEADCSQPIWLMPTKTGEVLLDGERMPLEKVAPTLSGRYSERKECRVMVRADRDVDYSDIVLLMNALDAAGFRKVALVAEEVVQ